MADLKDQLAGIASQIGEASPATYVSRRIAEVGSAATDLLSRAKARFQTPRRTTDIELPKEGKRPARPRSVSRGRR